VIKHGFTLFEVAVSALIFAVAILASIAVLPVGLHHQQIDRQRVYAATAALTFLDTFHKPLPRLQDLGPDGLRLNVCATEDGSPPSPTSLPTGPGAWPAANWSALLSASSAFAPDLEQALNGAHSGAFPIPPEIARRLDSDGDEIAEVLNAGGALYAIDANLIRGSTTARATAGERSAYGEELMRHLVFAVVGAPQQNVLPVHPHQGWPWYAHYPFPPQWKVGAGTTAYFNVVEYTGADLTNHRNDRDLNGDDREGDIRYGPGSLRGVTFTKADGRFERNLGAAGGTWAYLAAKNPASLWARGWPAYLELADDPEAGWLPVQESVRPGGAAYAAAVDPETTTTASGIPAMQPTYEMRASYRDRALRLWESVRPRPGSIAAVPVHPLILADAARAVTNTVDDCDHHEYGADQLDTFTFIDPWELNDGSGDFPPHPAQILALSHLAHAAMMVTGRLPPFESRRRDSAWWATFSERSFPFNPVIPLLDGGSEIPKDATIVTTDQAVGGTTVEVHNTQASPPPIAYFAGDWIYVVKASPMWNDTFHPAGFVTAEYAYEVAADVDNFSDPTQPVRIAISRAWQVAQVDATGHDLQGTGVVRPLGVGSCLQDSVSTGDVLIRVASEGDRRFARRVHEMMVRWTMAYAGENPNDFGAPRPANLPLATHHPLTQLDCFFDAGARANNGVATRFPTAVGSASESFYRWITGRNPATGLNHPNQVGPGAARDADAARWNFTRPGGDASWAWKSDDTTDPSHLFDNWEAIATNRMYDEPIPGQDAERFSVARPFSPSQRTRELVFWSVDWRAFSDAESAPSAPLARARSGRASYASDSLLLVESWWEGSPLAGNPEMKRIWSSADRTQIFDVQRQVNSTWARDDLDTLLGHWGADRNMNQHVDGGSIAPSARMRATTVARFVVYDPILRLHVEN
jgi:hypothetical protein